MVHEVVPIQIMIHDTLLLLFQHPPNSRSIAFPVSAVVPCSSVVGAYDVERSLLAVLPFFFHVYNVPGIWHCSN